MGDILGFFGFMMGMLAALAIGVGIVFLNNWHSDVMAKHKKDCEYDDSEVWTHLEISIKERARTSEELTSMRKQLNEYTSQLKHKEELIVELMTRVDKIERSII